MYACTPTHAQSRLCGLLQCKVTWNEENRVKINEGKEKIKENEHASVNFEPFRLGQGEVIEPPSLSYIYA